MTIEVEIVDVTLLAVIALAAIMLLMAAYAFRRDRKKEQKQ